MLLRREANRPVYTGRLGRQFPDGTAYHDFRYFVVRAWELHVDDLLIGGIGTLPLALLTDDAEPRLGEIVDRITARLDADRVPEATRLRVQTCGFLLGGLRYNHESLLRAFERVRGMRESSAHQMILREGRQESKQEDLLEFLRARFGPLPAALKSATSTLTGPPLLPKTP